MATGPFVADVGTQFDYIIRRDGAVFDLTGYTTGQISLVYQKADGTNLTVTPSTIVSPTAGHIRYVSGTTLLTVAGQYQVQAFVSIDASNKFHTIPLTFPVEPVL